MNSTVAQLDSAPEGDADIDDATDVDIDVVIVGYGPVGQVLAGLLGRAGHRVVVVERWPELYGRARAGHVDHEVMRILQAVDAAAAVEADAHLADQYVFQNAQGEVLMSFEYGAPGISGWRSDYIFYQPVLEAALSRTVNSCPSVDVRLGWQVTNLTQDHDGVDLVIQPRLSNTETGPRVGDEKRRLRTRYVVGADGAGSFVRSALGIEWDDLGFSSHWLVVDLVPIGEPLRFPYDNTQVCDPRRPHCMFQLGRHHRRFEFAVLPDEDAARLEQEQVAWDLMAPYGVTPQNMEIERRAVYRFGSAVARHWRRGRAFLIGDAAHLMPPFMGQGMCTGIRDAANLAWRLDQVLRRPALVALLDDYESERAGQSREIVQMSIAAGEVSCTFDPAVAAERDRLFREGLVSPPPALPGITSGLLTDTPLAGQVSPQGRIKLDGAVGRFDDLAGRGWTLIVIHPDAVQETSALERLRDDLDLRIVLVDETSDVDGTYQTYFEAEGIVALLVRPDFYIYGTASGTEQVESLVDSLATHLPVR